MVLPRYSMLVLADGFPSSSVKERWSKEKTQKKKKKKREGKASAPENSIAPI